MAMTSTKTELEGRTRNFALAVMEFVEGFHRGSVPDTLGRQLVRSATSIGANYREAQRGESKADFIHKVALCEKEASESCYWLDLCATGKVGQESKAASLMAEAEALLAIFLTIGKRAKQSKNRHE